MMGAPTIMGVAFSKLDLLQVRDALLIVPQPGTGVRLVVTANVDHLVQLERHLKFREAYAHAWLATVDGFPVSLLLRLKGFHDVPRVTGADICEYLIPNLAPDVHRPYYIASSLESAARLITLHLAAGFSRASIGITVPPFGFEHDDQYSQALAAKIRAHETTHLFFGVGAPKSEIWVDQYRAQLGDLFALSFGAGLDFLVGTAIRAPRWVRKFGMEWLWRLMCEPKRLFARYFMGAFRFARIATFEVFFDS